MVVTPLLKRICHIASMQHMFSGFPSVDAVSKADGDRCENIFLCHFCVESQLE